MEVADLLVLLRLLASLQVGTGFSRKTCTNRASSVGKVTSMPESEQLLPQRGGNVPEFVGVNQMASGLSKTPKYQSSFFFANSSPIIFREIDLELALSFLLKLPAEIFPL